jgi:TonB family protein
MTLWISTIRMLASLLVCLPLLRAAESVKDLAHNLKGKTLFLRGMYVENELSFDSDGKPTTQATPGPFSISAIRIDQVHVEGSTLEINGRRTVLMNTGMADMPQPRDIRFIPSAPVHIVMNGDPAHPEALAQLVKKVFAASVEDVLAGKSEAQRNADLFTVAYSSRSTQASPMDSSAAGIPDPANPGSTIPVYKTSQRGLTYPRAVYTVDPEFTDEARKKKFNGTYIVGMIVDTQGFPIRVHVIRSADPGLEDNSIAAVSQYRFSPAILEGKPVPVELAVEITFRIY